MKDNSLVLSLIDTLKTQIKRQFIILLLVIMGWFLTTLTFVWYINQFEYTNESSATIQTDNSGSIITGDIENG